MDNNQASLEALVRQLTRVGNCSLPHFSPDGSQLAFSWNVSGAPQVWIVEAEGGWPRQITALDDPVTNLNWSPSGEWLAVNIAPGGGMNGQIYLVRPDGTDLHLITDGGTDNNWLSDWSHDGHFLSFTSNRRDPACMDVWLAEIDRQGNPTIRLAVTNPGVGSFTDLSRDNRRAILYRQEQRSDNNLFLVNLPRDGLTAEPVLLTPHEGPASFDQARFSPDGQSIYLLTNHERDLNALGRIRLDEQGQPGPLEIVAAREDAELQDLAMDPQGQRLALLWNVAGRHELGWYEVSSNSLAAGPALPAEVVSSIEFSRDGTQLVLASNGSYQPSNVYLLELATQQKGFRQVTYSQHAGVKLEELVRPELVYFPAHDGLELSGWLYRPTGQSRPGPLVMAFHGGPEGQEQPVFNVQYQALLGRGIAVLAPNIRGSSGFGKNYMNLDNGELRFNAIKDVKACIDYVVGAGIAEPGRIGITGGSYGGYMTMAGLVEYPDLITAGVCVCGIVSFKTFFEHTEPWMAAISKIEYGDPDTQADLLERLSPLTRIERVKAPTLVLHGANDTNTPVIEAEQIVSSLKERSVPVEYILFPDEGHGFRKLSNRIRAFIATVEWFEKYLKAN
ncbi:MAG TPA: S9 family peptidase [Chloroflexia bacterium]|nr:S9 family peptidase [Chloroflexia bacterium]